jgi:hypothetical protein
VVLEAGAGMLSKVVVRSGLGLLVALALGLCSCGGVIRAADGGSPENDASPFTDDGASRDASSGSPPSSYGDADAPETLAAPSTCASPVIVPIGGSLSGSTCGGPQAPGGAPCQEPAHPSFYFAVDAPVGASFRVSAPGPVGASRFDSCGGTLSYCAGGAVGGPTEITVRPNDLPVQLFAIERFDVPCGDFSLTVVGL